MLRRRRSSRGWLMIVLSLVVSVHASEMCLAAKGGKGGRPGGGDPPAYPVQYSITRVATPGSPGYVYSDHNNAAAVVGWNWMDGTAGGRRAVAYVPALAASEAYTVEDLVVSGIPEGWHTRSAIGINNHGAIVGNLEPFGVEGLIGKPFLIPDIHSHAPELKVLGPFDIAADKEAALRVNDTGDVVVWSQKTVNGTTVDSLYLGNPGLHGEPASAFAKFDFASAGIVNPAIDPTDLKLSNRQGASPGKISGVVSDGDADWLFRMSFDGGDLEMLPIFEPHFSDAQGQHNWWSNIWNDLNDAGDVAGRGLVESAKGKGKRTLYAAVWPADTDEFAPVDAGSVSLSEFDFAATNNHGDYLLSGATGTFDTLWHNEWSTEHGSVAIADLIDPSDPNRSLFTRAREMTDRNGTGRPVLITSAGSSGSELLILTPHLNATPLAIAAVPEPAAVVLLVAAFLPLALRHAGPRKVTLSLTSGLP